MSRLSGRQTETHIQEQKSYSKWWIVLKTNNSLPKIPLKTTERTEEKKIPAYLKLKPTEYWQKKAQQTDPESFWMVPVVILMLSLFPVGFCNQMLIFWTFYLQFKVQ